MAEPRRRLSSNGVAVIVLVALGAVLLLWRQPWSGSTADEAIAIPPDAVAQISQQARDLSAATSLEQWAEAMGGSVAATSFADETWAARQSVEVDSVAVRYVTGGEIADRDDGSTEATFDVTWRGHQGSAFAGNHSATVAARIDPQSDGTLAIRTVRPVTGSLPLWLAGEVSVTTSGGTSVVRLDGGDTSFDVEAFSRMARESVESVLPDDRGDLTVISPSSTSQMAQLVGQAEDDIGQIAALTTNLDGAPGVPAVVVLNPGLYATMDARAGQVVLSHEATHVLTGALGSSAETWVVEGFADYVALYSDPAPIEVSAAQIIGQVRSGGAPDALPSAADFDSTGRGLGAVYESAWLIFRVLDQVGGRAAVIDFYRDVVAGVPTGKALDTNFGLTISDVTQRWQDQLRQLVK